MLTSIWFISSFLFSTPGEEVGIDRIDSRFIYTVDERMYKIKLNLEEVKKKHFICLVSH